MQKSLTQLVRDEKLDPDAILLKISADLRLTRQQIDFVKHYVENGGDKYKAALEAGYASKAAKYWYDRKDKSPEAISGRASVQTITNNVMNNKKVENAIHQYADVYQIVRRNKIESDVYRMSQLRATYDIRDMIETIVGTTPEEIVEKVKALSDEQAVCIDSITYDYKGKDANQFVVTCKFADRDKSLGMLAKLNGMMVDKKEVHNTGSNMPTINIAVLNK